MSGPAGTPDAPCSTCSYWRAALAVALLALLVSWLVA